MDNEPGQLTAGYRSDVVPPIIIPSLVIIIFTATRTSMETVPDIITERFIFIILFCRVRLFHVLSVTCLSGYWLMNDERKIMQIDLQMLNYQLVFSVSSYDFLKQSFRSRMQISTKNEIIVNILLLYLLTSI